MEDTTTCLKPKAAKYTKSVNLEMYNCDLQFIITSQLNKVVSGIYKKHKVAELFEDEVEGVVLFFNAQRYYVVIDIDHLSHNTIAHEIYHLSVKVTEDREITDEEAQAWLCGHLSGTLYKFLDNKKITVKHGG